MAPMAGAMVRPSHGASHGWWWMYMSTRPAKSVFYRVALAARRCAAPSASITAHERFHGLPLHIVPDVSGLRREHQSTWQVPLCALRHAQVAHSAVSSASMPRACQLPASASKAISYRWDDADEARPFTEVCIPWLPVSTYKYVSSSRKFAHAHYLGDSKLAGMAAVADTGARLTGRCFIGLLGISMHLGNSQHRHVMPPNQKTSGLSTVSAPATRPCLLRQLGLQRPMHA